MSWIKILLNYVIENGKKGKRRRREKDFWRNPYFDIKEKFREQFTHCDKKTFFIFKPSIQYHKIYEKHSKKSSLRV